MRYVTVARNIGLQNQEGAGYMMPITWLCSNDLGGAMWVKTSELRAGPGGAPCGGDI
jgi:hypothetical protein